MRRVFEASSGLDAHMILNLLQQQGITGRIEGEYLQGGIGELQAMGFVRVLVSERLRCRQKDHQRMGSDPAGCESCQTGSAAIRRITDFRNRGYRRCLADVLDIKRAQLTGPGSTGAIERMVVNVAG
jgi:hypothetical protein